MLNCLQVKNITAASPEELQEDLNAILKDLGPRVHKIDFLNPYRNSFGCSVTYLSQDIPAEMTSKIETLSEDPEAHPDDLVFVCVLHDYQRELVIKAIDNIIEEYQDQVKNPYNHHTVQDDFAHSLNNYIALLQRFADDNQPENVETKGTDIP